MHNDHDIYIQAVKKNKRVILTFFSGQKNLFLTKLCVPVYFSPPDSHEGNGCYFFWDEEGEVGERMLSLPQNKIEFMELSDETYNPADYICTEAK
jgi:hypothetical protein